MATFEDRPIQGSAAFDSIDPKLARLVGGRWPANENEQVVVRSGDAKKRTIGDVVPHYTLRGEVLTEIVGIFESDYGPYPPFYGLVGGPPVDLDTIPANVGQVMIYARLPKGVDAVEGVTRWTTAKMAGSVEYPHGVAVDFVCDLAPWLPNNCASASLVPDGGWVFGLEVAGLVFLVSLLMSGVTAVARRLRRRWRPGSSGRSGGWITSPTRSARWLLGLPIGICVAWLAYLPMHAIAARHQVEHLRVTPSMLGPIAIAGFFAMCMSLITWLPEVLATEPDETGTQTSVESKRRGSQVPSLRWVVAAALLTGGLATG